MPAAVRRAGTVLAAALLASPAWTAEAPRAADVPLPPVAPPFAMDAAPPPYQGRLDHLAELMGTLAFMRTLCGDRDGAAWRARMEALLASEGGTPARRDRLAGSFNRGYTGYALIYRACTPAAEAIIDRALAEGAHIAADMSAQFGTP